MRRLLGIRGRSILSVVLIISTLTFTLGLVHVLQTRRSLVRSGTERAGLLAGILADRVRLPAYIHDRAASSIIVSRLARIHRVMLAGVFVPGKAGELVLRHADAIERSAARRLLREVGSDGTSRRLLIAGRRVSVSARPVHEPEHLTYVAEQILTGAPPRSPLAVVAIDLEPAFSALHQSVINLGLVALLLALLAVGLMSVLQGRIVRPILRLARAASRVAAGDVTVQVESGSQDEVGQLADAFNLMVRNLERSYGELQLKQTEIEEQRQRLEMTLRDLPVAVLLIDAERRILLANPRAEELLPLLVPAPEERRVVAVGPLSLQEILAHQDDQSPLRAKLGGERSREFAVAARASANTDNSDPIVVLVIREVTAEVEQNRRAAQQERLALVEHLQAEQAQLERVATASEMAAITAHEIRTPLNALGINAQQIRRLCRSGTPEDGAEVARLAGGLKGEIDRVSNLLEEHLRVLRPLNVPMLRALSLAKEIETSVELVEREAERRSVEIRQSCADDLPAVLADNSKLRQVLVNLLMNATQAMKDGGRIEISATSDGAIARIRVADVGPGIPESNLSLIFNPFFTTEQQGTGLGLAICARLMKQMEGTIEAANRTEGTGAVFVLTLPLAPAKADEP